MFRIQVSYNARSPGNWPREGWSFGSLVGEPGKQGVQLIERGLHAESVRFPQLVNLAVLNELVGPADTDDGDVEAKLIERLKDGGAKAAHEGVVFKSDENARALGKAGNGVEIDGLDEARIDERGGKAFGGELLLKFGSEGDDRAEAEDGHVGA